LADTVAFLTDFSILPFPVAAIIRFEQPRALKLNIRTNNLRIAAITLEANATLVTPNLRDFGRVPGLAVVDWSA
jgi:predicted nucleic acid-binding protein